jgi:antitoxin protein of toxin-antitoxin system
MRVDASFGVTNAHQRTVRRMARGDIVGLGDKFGELKQKAEEAIKKHPDQVEQAIDKAEAYADKRTGGTHSELIDKGADQLKRRVDEQGPPPQ